MRPLPPIFVRPSPACSGQPELAARGGNRPLKKFWRRASVYVLVISSSTLLAITGLGALTAMRIQQRNNAGTNDFAEARFYARSAIEVGLRIVTSDSNWRSNYTNGNWKTNQTIGKGTYTLNVVDPNDGNLTNSMNDPFVITGTGMKGDARHQLSVTVTS